MALSPERIAELDAFYAQGANNAAPASPPQGGSTLTPERIAELDQLYGASSNKEQPKQRGIGEELGRQVGLTGRYLAEGATALPLMVGDAANAAVNYGIRGVNKVANTQIPELGSASGTFSQALTDVGLPNPETPTERVVGDISRALSGSGTSVGVGQTIKATEKLTPYAQKLLAGLAASPIKQAASGATGAAAAGTVREEGGSPFAQMMAAILSGSVPYAGRYAATQAPRLALRGGEGNAQRMRENIAAFEGVGTTPTLGQATESRALRGIESGLSRIPGGAGVMTRKAENQAQQISKGVEDIASSLAPNASGEKAGRAIEKGIKADFIPKVRQTQKTLYDNLDNFLPQEQPVSLNNTTNILGELTAPITGAKSVSNTSLLKNPVLNEVKEAITADLGKNGTLPYTALKQIRTRIGEKLEDIDLAPDIKRAELKRIYGSLTQDMEQAAKAAGPKAYTAFKKANNYTRALHERIDVLQSVIDKKGGPEKVFQAAISGAPEGATTLRAVMRSLPDDGKKLLSATVLRRLGKATPGNQNDLGDVFSTQTFLTNWNKLSPEAKQAAFGGYGKQFSNDMNQIAKVASNLKEGSKVFANPSGTSQAGANIGALTALGGAIGTGNIPLAGKVLAVIGTANASSHLLTNPSFVRWLATNSKKPAAALPSALNNLAQFAASKKDSELLDAVQLLQEDQ